MASEITRFMQEICATIDSDDYPSLLDKVLRSGLPTKNAIRRIAIFSFTLSRGGLERVALLLTKMFLERGFAVTLFTTLYVEHEYAVPDGVERVVLPRGRRERWESLNRELRDREIDLCLFNDHTQFETFYDISCAKAAGCRIVATEHSMFFYPFYDANTPIFEIRTQAYRVVDALTCLTQSDQLWWRAAGCSKAVHIPNPSTFQSVEIQQTSGESKQVLFVGRISDGKGLKFLPALIGKVTQRCAEARFVLAGAFPDREAESWFQREIEKYGVADSVETPGIVDNVSEYYARSSVVVILSAVEGFSMVRVEAQAHGVPVVMFDMAYLDGISSDDGCIMVGKEDVSGMADAVVRLLQDRNHWSEMSTRARNSFVRQGNIDVGEMWESLFCSILRGTVEEDFTPRKVADQAFLAMTMREMAAGMRYHRPYAERFDYLKPVDKFLSRVFPRGSARRGAVSGVLNSVRTYLRNRRETRRRRKQFKAMREQ